MSDFIKESSHPYVEAAKKYEDTKSTAWVFTLTGGAGIFFLLLLWTGILPLSFSFFTKCMASVVLGILFVFFLITGIKAFSELASCQERIRWEEAAIHDIQQWFQEHYSSDAISAGMDSEDISIDQLYYIRAENIGRLIHQEFSSYEKDFIDFMTENIYQMYFPDS